MTGKALCRRTFLALLTMGAAARAVGQDSPHPTIRMAFSGDYRPLTFRDQEGSLTGILIDVFQQLGAAAGLHFEYADLPWARAQQMVRSGRLDGLCTVSTPERRGYLEFAPTPVLDEPIVMVYRRGNERAEAARVPDGIDGLRFGEPLGDGLAKEALPGGQIERMADIDNLLGMIAAGRIDASLLGLWTAKTHLAALGLETRLSYRIVPVPASDSAMRFGLRKSFPHNREIVSKVDGAIKAMRDSGEIGRIIQRYGP